jgi:hypothetical protein
MIFQANTKPVKIKISYIDFFYVGVELGTRKKKNTHIHRLRLLRMER